MSEAPSAASLAALNQAWAAVENGARTILVDSPPGAGKSTLVREIARRSATKNQTPIVVQTNDQADDMLRGFIREAGSSPTLILGRLHSTKYTPPSDIEDQLGITFSTSIERLNHCRVVIAPAAKWARVDNTYKWPFAIVDEAYQMRSDSLLPIGTMMERLLLVGDPGQLAPFTPADDTRFRGRPLSPIETAAATVLTTHPETVRVTLPVSWRLSHHTAKVISDAFYRVPFINGVDAGVRRLEVGTPSLLPNTAVYKAARTGWAYVEMEDAIMPPTNDSQAVNTIASLVRQLLAAKITIHDEHGERPLKATDIAVGVTHRDQRDRIRVAIAQELHGLETMHEQITVDTANVLQGREFEVVVVWHPLSGRRDASTFHLESGRLCVLLSRHRQACIVVSRGGVREQLSSHPCTDPVWLGESAPVTDSWHAHLTILDHLDRHRV